MTEHRMHRIWSMQLYDEVEFFPHALIPQGIIPQIVEVGKHNPHAGPDFTEVKIRIGNWLWVGNAELHLKTSDFIRHHHLQDPNYAGNLILHVVFENDTEIDFTPDQEPFCCRLSVSPETINRVKSPLSYELPLCGEALAQLLPPKREELWNRMSQERMTEKVEQVRELFHSCEKDTLSTLHILLFRYMGSKVNNDAFEQIARSLPLSVIYKHSDSLLQLESLFLGQAGLFSEVTESEFADSYSRELYREYHFLRIKYQLSPLPAHRIKHLRLRPASFPHRRLAILAALYHQSSPTSNRLLFAPFLQEIKQALHPTISDYWQHHYKLGSPSTEKSLSSISSSTIEGVIINVIIPLRLFLSQTHEVQTSSPTLLSLEDLPAEKNKIVSTYQTLGIPVLSARDSQAILHLYNKYCQSHQCAQCSVGKSLLTL